jgi:ABC-type Fe3+ transport system permease subunit
LLLLFLPFWTSYVVRTFVWLPILGITGAINQFLLWLGVIDQPIGWLLYNEGTVYLGLVYVYTLFMTLPIFLSIEKIDPRLIEAASDLGARLLGIFLAHHPAAKLAGRLVRSTVFSCSPAHTPAWYWHHVQQHDRCSVSLEQ